MDDPKKRVAEMLRRVARPVQIPRPASPPGAEEDFTEGLEIARSLEPTVVDREKMVERVAPDNRTHDLGMKAFEKVDQGDDLSVDEMNVAEAIILLEGRPCIDIQNDTFGELPPEWTQLANFRSSIDKAIRAVGRIELPNLPSIPYGGTGFVVGKNLIMTNRHVAELFTEGVGQKKLLFKKHVGTAIDFGQEINEVDEPRLLKVKKTLLVHPHWDAALLQVDGLPDEQIMTLAASEPTHIDGRAVVVIGYPMIDSRNDMEQQRRIFRGVFGKKRLLPGTLVNRRGIRSFGNTVEALTHDSSTLGGNSGSLVLDLEMGKVLGLHFAGRYMDANFAVPSWELAADKRLTGLHFDSSVRPAVSPKWLKVWDNLKETTTIVAPTPVESGQRTAVADWFERTTTDELVEANRRNPEGTKALLLETLLPDEAESLIADIERTEMTSETFPPTGMEEGLFSPRVDPNLPEIVFLHGITGCHLSGGSGFISRVWLNPLAFVAGDLAEKLTLANDGQTDAHPGSHLVADGHIRYVYERAARTWRQGGFVVHPFSFDWRKGIANAADRLHLFLENLQLERPTGKPVVLVAHSMGGLVASLYAHRHNEWEERVGQAIFMGSPVRGSFAPVSAGLGTYAFLLKLAKLSRNDNSVDLQRMACSLPGLMDMMPDPAVFTDAEVVYKPTYWPAHMKPQPALLKQSKELKPQFAQSPLLQITTGIVSLVHGTVASLQPVGGPPAVGPATGVGDGTVPARSAVITGRPNFKAMFEHADLPREPAVIQAVMDLIKTGTCQLKPVTDADDLNATIPAAETTDPIPLEESLLTEATLVESIGTRIQNGIFTQADYDWLMRS